MEAGHDLAVRWRFASGITGGAKAPGTYPSSGQNGISSKIRYAFMGVTALNGSQVQMKWQAQRFISPFDQVDIPGTLTPLFTPAIGQVYFSRLDTGLVGSEIMPLFATEKPAEFKTMIIRPVWIVSGGTSVTANFWEVFLDPSQFPNTAQIHSSDLGSLQRDANGNDKCISDLTNIIPSSVLKPNGQSLT